MISILKITKGNNSAKNVGGVTFDISAWSCFIFLPSFVKLSQAVSKLKSGHDFYTENYKGE